MADMSRVDVLDGTMAYRDHGPSEVADGQPTVVFLHGNPASSYLWRNVIPHVSDLSRCLAPDLIGMGESSKRPGTGDDRYRFVEHARYLDAWFDAVVPSGPVVLVIHDWGSALGFYWAHRHQDRVAGIAYTEAIVGPLTWDDWPESSRRVFQGFRSDAGEKLILDDNIFVERVLPAGDPAFLDAAAMEVYRAPFRSPGEDRRPTLTWPRQIPIEGEPADVHDIVAAYSEWLTSSPVPKLLGVADPGVLITGRMLELARTFPNQTEFTVPGVHFVQEHSPHEFGENLRAWLVGSVLS